MMNHLARRGADVIYGTMNPPIHVSGHGSAEELRLVLNLVRPKYFRPHPRRISADGEARPARPAPEPLWIWKEPSFSNRARRWRSTSDGARKGEPVTVGRVCIDSGTLDEVVEDMVIRDRRHLSEDGFVLPIIAINKHTGRCEGLPEIVSRGFMSMEDSTEVLQEARQAGVEDARIVRPPKSAATGA